MRHSSKLSSSYCYFLDLKFQSKSRSVIYFSWSFEQLFFTDLRATQKIVTEIVPFFISLSGCSKMYECILNGVPFIIKIIEDFQLFV